MPLVATPEFVRAHTVATRPALVPELTIRTAPDVVGLWEAIEAGFDTTGLDPPFWAAAWPGGQVLARYVLDHPALVAGRTVLDLGTGGGLVAVAAARAGALHVMASDVDPFCAAAVAVNAAANDVTGIEVVGDVLGAPPPDVDVVLAGDVCYDRAMAARVLPFLFFAWAAGGEVVLGDPGRTYLPRTGLTAVAAYDVPDVETSGTRRTTVWRLGG